MRAVFATAVAGLLAAGCAEGPEQANKEVARSYLQALLVDVDWDQWDNYFDPAASINGSGFALQIMRGAAHGLHFSFSDLELEISQQVAEGDWVATRFALHGVHERPFNDQPATHAPVELNGFVMDRFRAGRVAESRMLLDVWGLSRSTAAAAARAPRGVGN
jgi:predicted ester cyclase